MQKSRKQSRIDVLVIVAGGITAASFGLGLFLVVSKPSARTEGGSKPETAEEQLVSAASDLLDRKQTEQALELYRRVLAGNPQSLTAQLGVANAELQAGREALAAREFERVLQLDAKHADSALKLASLYSSRKETWTLAEGRYRDYLQLEPNSAQARLALARVLAWQGKARDAAEVYSIPAVSRLMMTSDRRNYAFALMKTGHLDQAEVVLRGLEADHSADFELRLQLANLYASRKDWRSALPRLRELAQQQPNNPQVNLTYGLGLLATREYRPALDPLRKARTAMPSSGDAGLGYARALKGAHEVKSAAKEFDRVIPRYQHDAQIVREYADLLFEKGDARNAAKYYRQAHALGLHDTRLLVGLSGSLLKLRKPREALPYLEQAYEQEPTDRLAFELAKVYHITGKHQQALAALNRVRTTSSANRRVEVP